MLNNTFSYFKQPHWSPYLQNLEVSFFNENAHTNTTFRKKTYICQSRRISQSPFWRPTWISQSPNLISQSPLATKRGLMSSPVVESGLVLYVQQLDSNNILSSGIIYRMHL